MKYDLYQHTILICICQNNIQSALNFPNVSLHKNTLSLQLSFNSSMYKHVKCGWSLNLYIHFSITPNTIYKKLVTIDVSLIRTILDKKWVDKCHEVRPLKFLFKLWYTKENPKNIVAVYLLIPPEHFPPTCKQCCFIL